MRCEPPIPAQFIRTRATPCDASALAMPALTCSSSVTSAWMATPFTSADVTDEEQVKAGIAKAEASHGVARVLMNCAGIGGSQRIVGRDGVYPLAKFVRIIN